MTICKIYRGFFLYTAHILHFHYRIAIFYPIFNSAKIYVKKNALIYA